MTERRQGNDFYRQGNFRKALYHYKRAAGVTEFVMALSRADQEEVDVNKLAAYLNIAAAYMGLQARPGFAFTICIAAGASRYTLGAQLLQYQTAGWLWLAAGRAA